MITFRPGRPSSYHGKHILTPELEHSVRPEQAWETALAQLQMEMPKAAFDMWAREARLIACEDGLLTVAAPNAYARDWLESRLSSTLARLLTGILNQPVQMRFVIQPDAPAASQERINQEPPDLDWGVNLNYLALREALVEPHKVVVVPGYFRRWVPFLGPTLASIVVAFRQVMYLCTGKGATEGVPFSVSPQQIANWAGVDRTTLWRHMDDHQLRWFLQRSGEREHAYEFIASMPLTPGDAERLRGWLVERGAREDPLAALEAALEARVEDIWPSPPPSPRKEHLEMEPHPAGVQTVALAACGNVRAGLFEQVSELADRLAVHLMPPQDLIVISHYYLKNWMQRLGSGPAWLVTLLRDECYLGKDELRDTVWVQGGNAEIARMLGLKGRGAITVSEWLPPLPGSPFERPSRGPSSEGARQRQAYRNRIRRREAKRAVVGRFLQRVDHQEGNGATAWQFRVSLLEPLIPEDQAHYDLVVGLLQDFLRTGELHLLRMLAGGYAGDYADATNRYADATDDYAFATNPPQAITRLQQAVTRLQQESYAHATRDYAFATGRLRIRDALSTLNLLKIPLLELIDYLEGLNTPTPTTPEARTRSGQTKSEAISPSNLVVDASFDKWELESLFHSAQLHPGTRRRIRQSGAQAWTLVSHLLYAYSPPGAKADNPLALAASAMLEDPSSGFGGYYDILARMPPGQLANLIAQAHASALEDPLGYLHSWRSGVRAWDEAMGRPPAERLRELALRLGLTREA
jgi:hypothetical protein